MPRATTELTFRSIIPVVVFALIAVATSIATSHAAPTATTTPQCALVAEPTRSVSAVTGGEQINFSYDCTGKGIVEEVVNIRRGLTTYFRAVANVTVEGSTTQSQEIHLPLLSSGDPVCIELNGAEHCVP